MNEQGGHLHSVRRRLSGAALKWTLSLAAVLASAAFVVYLELLR